MQNVERFLFVRVERENILNSKHEERDDEEAPEADEDADGSPEERLRIDVTITNTRESNNHIPYAVNHIREVLLRDFIQLRFKNAKLISKNDGRNQQRIKQHPIRSLLHQALDREEDVGVAAVDPANPL